MAHNVASDNWAKGEFVANMDFDNDEVSSHYSYNIGTDDGPYDYPIVMATGYGYNIHWRDSVDYYNFKLYASRYVVESDNDIYLRFPHIKWREVIETTYFTN